MPTGIFFPHETGEPLRERMQEVGFHRAYNWDSKVLQCDISIMKCLAANHFTNEILHRHRTSWVVRDWQEREDPQGGSYGFQEENL